MRGKYSRFVSYLKIGLPLVAILLLGTVFLVTSPDDFAGPGLVFTDADRDALGQGLQVNGATISGATRSGDTYVFKAAVLVPDSLDANKLAASTVSGSITTGGGITVELSADQASLDRSNKTFQVSGRAHLETSDGYVANTEGLIGDFTNGTLESMGLVTVDGPTGHIQAGSLLLTTAPDDNENTTLHFDNGVRLIFKPKQP